MFTSGQVELLHETFAAYDHECRGYLSRASVLDVLRELGVDGTRDQGVTRHLTACRPPAARNARRSIIQKRAKLNELVRQFPGDEEHITLDHFMEGMATIFKDRTFPSEIGNKVQVETKTESTSSNSSPAFLGKPTSYRSVVSELKQRSMQPHTRSNLDNRARTHKQTTAETESTRKTPWGAVRLRPTSASPSGRKEKPENTTTSAGGKALRMRSPSPRRSRPTVAPNVFAPPNPPGTNSGLPPPRNAEMSSTRTRKPLPPAPRCHTDLKIKSPKKTPGTNPPTEKDGLLSHILGTIRKVELKMSKRRRSSHPKASTNNRNTNTHTIPLPQQKSRVLEGVVVGVMPMEGIHAGKCRARRYWHFVDEDNPDSALTTWPGAHAFLRGNTKSVAMQVRVRPPLPSHAERIHHLTVENAGLREIAKDTEAKWRRARDEIAALRLQVSSKEEPSKPSISTSSDGFLRNAIRVTATSLAILGSVWVVGDRVGVPWDTMGSMAWGVATATVGRFLDRPV